MSKLVGAITINKAIDRAVLEGEIRAATPQTRFRIGENKIEVVSGNYNEVKAVYERHTPAKDSALDKAIKDKQRADVACCEKIAAGAAKGSIDTLRDEFKDTLEGIENVLKRNTEALTAANSGDKNDRERIVVLETAKEAAEVKQEGYDVDIKAIAESNAALKLENAELSGQVSGMVKTISDLKSQISTLQGCNHVDPKEFADMQRLVTTVLSEEGRRKLESLLSMLK